MIDLNLFPHNADGSLKTKQPCQTKGCDYPNFHVCLVGKENTFLRILEEEGQGLRRRGSSMSDHQREAIAEGQRRRWAQVRAANNGRRVVPALTDVNHDRWAEHRRRTKERDEKLIARYNEGNVSQHNLRLEFGLGSRAIKTILYRAAEEGKVTLRERGTTLTAMAARTDSDILRRNEEIVERYAKGDIGIRPLAKMFNTSTRTVSDILHAARDEGKLIMRPMGQNV